MSLLYVNEDWVERFFGDANRNLMVVILNPEILALRWDKQKSRNLNSWLSKLKDRSLCVQEKIDLALLDYTYINRFARSVKIGDFNYADEADS